MDAASEATPPRVLGDEEARPPRGGQRRGAVDVARVLALGLVVLGHLALAVVDHDTDGAIRGDNLLALRPSWAWVAALAPMPVFFAAGGWANATTDLRAAAPRLRTLVGLGAVLVAVWGALVAVAALVADGAGVVGDGARLATQPLWFLAVYVPFAAAGRPLARVGSTHPVLAVGGCLLVLAALDTTRFVLDGPSWVGWIGFPLAWGVAWLAGGWWRDRWEAGALDERRAGALLLVGFGAVGALLVAVGGYHPALIDAVAGERSNTTPPTLYTAVAGLAQVGGLLLVAGLLDRAASRWRRLWDRAGEAAVGVYVWHLTALALVLAVVAAGAPVPERLTGLWWATRPLWWAIVLAATGVLVAATAAVRARVRRPVEPPSAVAAVVGAGLAAAGAAAVGLEGPRTPAWAAACVLPLAGAWILLASPPWSRGAEPVERRGEARAGRGA